MKLNIIIEDKDIGERSFLLQVFGHDILAKIIMKHHRNIFFKRVSAGVKIRGEEAVLCHKGTLYS